jgi:predicted metal-dependent hydrolase
VILNRLFKKTFEPTAGNLQVGSRTVPLLLVHHPRARRYLLRLRPNGVVRVTIPSRGSVSAARDFASRNICWLEQQLQRLAVQPKTPASWDFGMEILFRG